MWKAVIVLAIINKIVFWGFCSDICDDRSAVTECDYAITPHPIVDNIISARSGIAQETCMGLLMKFKFDFGVYCETSVFCGLGLELEKDYSHLALSDNFPVLEKCLVIVNQKRHTCESVKIKLYEAGLLSDQLLCEWTGNRVCMDDRNTVCVQLEGNFMCDGCYPGYQPVDPPSEQNCQDINECDLKYCGPCQDSLGSDRCPCTNQPGFYFCDCPIGFVFNTDVAPGCYEELPGYNVDMVYMAYSGANLYYQYYHHSLDTLQTAGLPGLTNYINPDAHDNIRTANEIVFVVYDDDNNPRERLTFRGIHKLDGWFDANNILNSSNWDVSTGSNFGVFKMHLTENAASTSIEISKNEEICGGSGFLRVNCDLSERCADFQWWKDDQTLQSYACGIQYSKLKEAAEYEDAYLAMKFTIFTTKYPAYNGNWLLNFRLSSSTQARFLEFFLNGGVHSDGLNYRDKNIRENFENANYVMLVLYSDSDNVEDTFVFDAKTSGLTSWFSLENILGLNDTNFDFELQLYGPNNFTFLNIGKNLSWIDDCENAFGRLTVISKPTTLVHYDKLCPFQRFWETRNGYCAIMYSTAKEGTFWNNGNYKFASKIEISTSIYGPSEIPWNLVFRVQSYSEVDFLKYFKNGCSQTLCTSYPDQIYRHGNLPKKLEDASEIKVMVFKKHSDENPVLEFIFDGVGHSEDWFSESGFASSATHKEIHFPRRSEFKFHFVDETGKYFYIGQEQSDQMDCSGIHSWLYILTEEQHCSNKKLNEKNKYPEIRYEKNLDGVLLKDLRVAEKLEIYLR